MTGQGQAQVIKQEPTVGPEMSTRQKALLHLGQILSEGAYRFITPTPVTHARVNQRVTNQVGLTLEDVFGWNRPFAKGMLDPEQEQQLLASGVIAEAGAGFVSRVRWSSLDGLLVVHSAFPTVEDDSVFFGPDTYRFAHSINAFLGNSSHTIRRAVDIGCGTGAGALLIAKARPEADVIGVDINPQALALAQVNASLADLDNLAVQHSNILNDVSGQFDLIVANPPYMKDSRQRAYRHGGDSLGADLSVRILRESLTRLSNGGSLVLYTGVAIVGGEDPFMASIARDLDQRGLSWSYRELDPDVFGEELLEPGYERVDRIAAVELIVTRR